MRESSRERNLEHALALALEYTLGRQRSDGSWIDWDLPPGQSSVWTTAFVGCKLGELLPDLRKQAAASAESAAKWLSERTFSDGGWGYSEEVDSDADSTALAILCLASAGKDISEASYACLQSFQCTDGGFATFRGLQNLGTWGISHGDVTPTAIFAMMTKYSVESDPVARGIDFLLNQKTSAGIWRSFWWTSFLYSTERSLHLMRAAGQEVDLRATRNTLLHTDPRNSFESALLLSSLLCFEDTAEGKDIGSLVGQLLQSQEPDGSWQSSPMLRVTSRACLEPWKPGDPDRLYRDLNRLFTTTTVMSALSRSSMLLK